MKHLNEKSGFLALALALGLASPALGDLTFEHQLFTPAVDLDAGTQNAWAGTVGNAFATWQAGAVVSHLGYYDSLGDGLANSHTINLFLSSSSGGTGGADSILASVIIPAGTDAPLVNGYRWVALSEPLALPQGTWYTVSADVDGVDLFGDKITGGQVTMDDPYYSTGGWNSPYARYGNDPVSDEPLFGAYAQSIYPAVNVGLAAVPEPSCIALGCAGLLVLFVRRGVRQ